MKIKSLFAVTFIALLLCLPGTSVASDSKAREADTLIFYLENDSVFNTDRYYTNGIKSRKI